MNDVPMKKRESDKVCVGVDWGLCIGCQVCVMGAGNTFRMTENSEGEPKAEVVDGFSDDSDIIEEARTSCPVEAILVKKDNDPDTSSD